MSVIPQNSKTYTGFTPTSIPNCALWLDAADRSSGSMTLSSSTVTSWKDKSGNANNMPLSGANVGTSNTSGTLGNSLSTITNASNRQSTNKLIGSSGAAPQTFIIVGNSNSTINGISMLRWFSATDGTGNAYSGSLILTIFSTSVVLGINQGGGDIPASAISTSKTKLAIGMYDGSTMSLYESGTLAGSNTGITLNQTNGTILIGPNSSTVEMGEVIIYNAALTTSQRQQLEGYLAWKWGLIGNLPNTHPFKYTPLYTRVFQPIDIAGCSLWLDGADASTVTLSASNVTAWADKSGNGYTGSFSAGRNFTYATNVKNGLNCIQTATGQTMTISNFVSNAIMSLFHVYMPINHVNGSAFIEQGPDVNGTDGFYFFSQGNYNFAIRNNGAITNSNFGNTSASNTWEIIECINKDPNASNYMSYYSNGTLKSATTATSNNVTVTNTLNINGRNNSNTLSYATYIAEIIFYNVALTNSQRLQVEGYLANKWGLKSNLPSTHPFKLYVTLSVQFIPINIPGCALWLDAADISSNSMVLSGSTITTWKDKSGNGYSGTSSGSPTLITNTQNGLPVVNFISSSSQYFNFGDINDLGTNPFHIFIVSKFNSTASGTLFAKSVQGNSSGRYALLRESSTIIPLIESPGGNASGGPSDTSTSTRILTMFWNRSTLGLIQNGSSISSGTQVDSTNLNTTFPFLVGAYNNGSGGVPPAAGLYFNGYMMEFIMYLGTITTSQRQQIEGYLAWKWGIQNSLPSTHPFRKIRN